MSLPDWLQRLRGAAPDAPPAERRPLLREDGTPYELALYKYDACPYCRRVLNAIDRLGIEVEYRDTLRDRGHARDLHAKTGRGTVPCLFIDGQPMFESLDIIRWLEARAARPARTSP